jgi:hypothetical protein
MGSGTGTALDVEAALAEGRALATVTS